MEEQQLGVNSFAEEGALAVAGNRAGVGVGLAVLLFGSWLWTKTLRLSGDSLE